MDKENTLTGEKIHKHNNHKHTKHKLGQIETFGLAFIVILISIGFFIFISFRSQQAKEDPQKEYTNDKLSSDFVLSIKQVSVQDCQGFTINDLIIDCATDKRIRCGLKDSCTAANESITIMLNRTFMVRNMRFRFYSENLIDINSQEVINISYLNCTSRSPRQGQAGELPIKLYPSSRIIYLKMNICY